MSTLPSDAIVYYLLFYQDGNGENQNPLDFSPVISRRWPT